LIHAGGEIKSMLEKNVYSFAKKTDHSWVFELLEVKSNFQLNAQRHRILIRINRQGAIESWGGNRSRAFLS